LGTPVLKLNGECRYGLFFKERFRLSEVTRPNTRAIILKYSTCSVKLRVKIKILWSGCN